MTAASRRRASRLALAKHLLAVGACCLLAAPFLWMLVTSLKGPQELALQYPTLIPRHPDPGNYARVLVRAGFGRYFLNSALVAVATTLIAVAVAALAGYAFARFRLPGGKALLLGILATQMFPGILLAIPLYGLLRDLRLLDSLPGLVLVYTTFALPFCVWMLRNAFLAVPRELEESALVDGCSRLGALWRVVVPVALPGIAATAIFSFILAWNEFLYANTFISSAEKRTLAVGLESLIGEFTTDWGLLMAGAVVTTAPLVLAFLAIQRRLTQGLAAGAVKG
ncbi:MAG TPA: carbohydrate ABC transporter permease [Thermomicrobiales bacterium]|nr:carbohydrate ABC transporter permease [Thermomicrobiales bacterium]